MSHPETQQLEGFELSPQQFRLWHAQQGRIAAAVHTAQLTLRSARPFDASRLASSLQALIERHEILRTRYQRLPGMAWPVQAIAAPTSPAATLGLVLSLDPAAHMATLQLPALHADTASLHCLAEEWAQRYLGLLPGELALQYADYAAWRSEAADDEGRRFWQAQVAAAAPAVPPPLHRRLPTAPVAGATARVVCTLNAGQQQAWQQAAAQLGLRPATVALAAWAALWFRHSESDRLTLGYELPQRGGPLREAIGLFSEPLPLTVDALDTLRFDQLCHRVAERCALLSEWQDSYPSEIHAGAEAPALPVGFRELPPLDQPALADAGWRIETADSVTAPFQLLLEHCPGSPQPFTLRHDVALYSERRAALLADQFSALLEHACRQPGQTLSALSATSADELHRLTTKLASAPALTDEQQRQYEEIAGLPHLAACFARLQPHAASDTAVCAAGGMLTHAELEARAAALAQHLLARGLRPEARVAHFLPRDLDAVVGLLAILKAGACYVPVDPAYPVERIDHILRDSEAELVLTRQELLSRLPQAWHARSLLVEEASRSPAPVLRPWPAIAPHHSAYLIYTSGSTGRPKGVVITHANALHSLAARVAYYPQPVRRFLLLSSFAFDSSIAGLFWSLAQGGCLHVASEDEQKDPAQLARLIREHGVTHLLALPSLHALLLEQLGQEPTALNTVIVAGETCPPALVDTHFRHQPQTQLYNEYGPTEASVWSTVARCRPEAGNRPVPIGRAIPHSRVYLLDEQGAPVARGIKGEVYVAGPGVSPGYLHRAELTAERFIEARHPALAGERCYRTGDQAYFDEDDQLVFLGRGDTQVKLRGYRIELGEIEALLCTACGATQSVALLDSTDPANPRLRAFVEPAMPLQPAQLRETLARQLPEHMVPADIQVLASLPRTANGKVDTHALLSLASAPSRPPYAAPRSHTERVLAMLWEELLGTAPIGLQDDFFALGGHSLLVVKLVHRIQATLHKALAVSVAFQHPTLAALAAVIEQPDAAHPLVTLRPGAASRPALFCLHRPSGEVHHYLPLAAALPAGQRVYGIPLPAELGPHNARLSDLAARYLQSLRTVQPEGPYQLCGWSMGGLLALELAHLLEQQGEEVALLSLVDTTFHAEDDPLDFTALLQTLAGELSPRSQALLRAMPAEPLEALRAATAGLGKVGQLRLALLNWTARHGLQLHAPREHVEAALDAMQAARAWLQGYEPPRVRTAPQCWWAEATLAQRPQLPAQWSRLIDGAVHRRQSGDHDTILTAPGFHAEFVALLDAVPATVR